jgi:hypothetical protein
VFTQGKVGAMNLLDKSIIGRATQEFASDPKISKRLSWWLLHGQSCERWVQFEWAYRLQGVLQKEFPSTYVGFERYRIDVVIYKGPPYDISTNAWQQLQDIKAGIELKWFGSWAFDIKYSIDEFKEDIKKIKGETKYPFPALALAIFLVAKPKAATGSPDPYAWISKQVNGKKRKGSNDEIKGFYDYSEMRDKLFQAMLDQKPVQGRDYFEAGPYPITAQDFEKLEIWSVGFYNDKAKLALKV